MDEEAMPLPSDDKTPPVMKIYFDVFGTQPPLFLDGFETTNFALISPHVTLDFLMRRALHTALTAVFVAVAAFGCSSESDQAASSKTIRFWHFWSEPGQKTVLQEIVADFEKKTGVKVELTELSWNDGKVKLQAAFNSGAPPDVIELGSDWIAQFSSAGVLMELPGDANAVGSFVPYSLAPGTWNNRIYAYPWIVDTRVLYLNRGLLDNAGWKGAITTLDQLLDACEAVQGTGAYGFGANGDDAHRLYKKILPMMWTVGGDIMDASGTPTLNSPQNIEALDRYAKLARTGFIETQRQLDAAFVQGRVAAWVSGGWLLPKLRAASGLKFEAVLLPGVGSGPGLSFAGGEYLAVAAKTGNSQRAREFVQYMTSGEHAIRMCAKIPEAGFPADKRYFSDPQLLKDPVKKVFAQQLEHARMTPVHPRWLDLEAVIEKATVRVLLGEMSPKEALDEAQDEALIITRK